MSHPPQTPRRLWGLVLITTGGLGGMAHLPQFFPYAFLGLHDSAHVPNFVSANNRKEVIQCLIVWKPR